METVNRGLPCLWKDMFKSYYVVWKLKYIITDKEKKKNV